MESSESKNEKPKNNWLSWFLWWQVDNDELQRQVNHYETLKMYQSARGISTILLLLSAGLTSIFILFLNMSPSGFFDVFLFLLLAYFVFKGHRWAMIAAMILWTTEKLFIFLAQYQMPSSSLPHTGPIVSLLWWAVYMHAFYLAYRVEKLRAQKKA